MFEKKNNKTKIFKKSNNIWQLTNLGKLNFLLRVQEPRCDIESDGGDGKRGRYNQYIGFVYVVVLAFVTLGPGDSSVVEEVDYVHTHAVFIDVIDHQRRKLFGHVHIVFFAGFAQTRVCGIVLKKRIERWRGL